MDMHHLTDGSVEKGVPSEPQSTRASSQRPSTEPGSCELQSTRHSIESGAQSTCDSQSTRPDAQGRSQGREELAARVLRQSGDAAVVAEAVKAELLPAEVAKACPVCVAGEVGISYTREIRACRKSAFEVAQLLDCTVEEVMRHINDRHEFKKNASGQWESQDEILGELSRTLNTLKEWTTFVVESVKNGKDLDRSKVYMLTTLLREARSTLEFVTELQGRKGPGDQAQQIMLMQEQIRRITGMIVTEVPQECKPKIAEKIQDILALPPGKS